MPTVRDEWLRHGHLAHGSQESRARAEALGWEAVDGAHGRLFVHAASGTYITHPPGSAGEILQVRLRSMCGATPDQSTQPPNPQPRKREPQPRKQKPQPRARMCDESGCVYGWPNGCHQRFRGAHCSSSACDWAVCRALGARTASSPSSCTPHTASNTPKVAGRGFRFWV